MANLNIQSEGSEGSEGFFHIPAHTRGNKALNRNLPQTLRRSGNLHGEPFGIGGQHRAPVGVSTLDGEAEQERGERHRRAYDWSMEPPAWQQAMNAFEAERQAVINEKPMDVPF